MKTKPFNLEQALSGRPVITSRNEPATYLTDTINCGTTRYWFKLRVNNQKDDAIDQYDENGHSTKSGSQLLMLCEEKEYWIATAEMTHVDGHKFIETSAIFIDEFSALKNIEAHFKFSDIINRIENVESHKIIRYE